MLRLEESGPLRLDGTLESFDLTPGKAHGFAQTDKGLLHLPMANRGVLEDDTIRRCNNSEHYALLQTESALALDVNFDSQGQNPFVVAWAPKTKG